jgi:hypothetical protein
MTFVTATTGIAATAALTLNALQQLHDQRNH